MKRYMTPARLFTLGFALIILVGAGLLCLPAANKLGQPISFINALFTAGSATCVTGLAVYDTWSQFTVLGQVIIILLIQLGGLGFMTFAILLSMASGRRIGLRERIDISEAISAGRLGGVVKLVKRILLGTLLIEVTGAVLLSIRFIPIFGAGTGVWYGVFHSISAFCNAGFDLMGVLEPSSSLTHFVGDPLVNVTIMLLIILGGLGFIVWDDVLTKKFRFRQLALHTKIVLAFTLGAIIVPSILFALTENSVAFAGMSGGEKALASVFCAVTPRTAGFSTVNCADLSSGGVTLTTLLMMIGAGSGSTGGGMKITTFAVLALSVAAYCRNRRDVNVMQRRIDATICRRAFCSALLYIGVGLLASYVIMCIQPLGVKEALFECFSALGTVGLTLGATTGLTTASKIVIILLMYAGRVGSLTLFMAVTDFKNESLARYPEEPVIIG